MREQELHMHSFDKYWKEDIFTMTLPLPTLVIQRLEIMCDYDSASLHGLKPYVQFDFHRYSQVVHRLVCWEVSRYQMRHLQ